MSLSVTASFIWIIKRRVILLFATYLHSVQLYQLKETAEQITLRHKLTVLVKISYKIEYDHPQSNCLSPQLNYEHKITNGWGMSTFQMSCKFHSWVSYDSLNKQRLLPRTVLPKWSFKSKRSLFRKEGNKLMNIIYMNCMLQIIKTYKQTLRTVNHNNSFHNILLSIVLHVSA